ncbi:MAG: hypothetical protein JL50_03145 [Peptococcaceae bacterium BICA1-7]|nr:MAG: hypothetical protein JL50_03145 [Peptococcaceae bacterium BICA1-7]HBV97739.1 hypothetical protein [Desulfotomaculum sp.]
MIKSFPTHEDRAQCHTALQLYAQGRWDRQEMMSFISGVLDKYGISQLRVDNFSVRKGDPVVTNTGSWPVVIIIADQQAYSRCPVCNASAFDYLAGQAPEITAWCRGCGSIYRKEVRDERTEKGRIGVDLG